MNAVIDSGASYSVASTQAPPFNGNARRSEWIDPRAAVDHLDTILSSQITLLHQEETLRVLITAWFSFGLFRRLVMVTDCHRSVPDLLTLGT